MNDQHLLSLWYCAMCSSHTHQAALNSTTFCRRNPRWNASAISVQIFCLFPSSFLVDNNTVCLSVCRRMQMSSVVELTDSIRLSSDWIQIAPVFSQHSSCLGRTRLTQVCRQNADHEAGRHRTVQCISVQRHAYISCDWRRRSRVS